MCSQQTSHDFLLLLQFILRLSNFIQIKQNFNTSFLINLYFFLPFSASNLEWVVMVSFCFSSFFSSINIGFLFPTLNICLSLSSLHDLATSKKWVKAQCAVIVQRFFFVLNWKGLNFVQFQFVERFVNGLKFDRDELFTRVDWLRVFAFSSRALQLQNCP